MNAVGDGASPLNGEIGRDLPGQARLARLAEEQAALRRVATLVARGAAPEEVFTAVAGEVGRLLPVDQSALCRYEPDGTLTFVSQWGSVTARFPAGSRWTLGGHNVGSLVFQTGRPARADYSAKSSSGPLGVGIRQAGLRSAIGTPVIVEGRLWGTISVASQRDQPLPADTEARLVSFTELVATAIANAESHAALTRLAEEQAALRRELLATAIANAESRSELAASSRRIVAASDETRRRIERDLHDGTQQRLVSLALVARAAEADVHADRGELRAYLSRIVSGLADAVAELQEFSRGIHPTILSVRGLGPALRSLARRSAVPVDLDVTIDARYPEPIEIAAYYVASEALANAMKHAQASHIGISLAMRNGSLLLSIGDDGIGGADPARGSGLVGPHRPRRGPGRLDAHPQRGRGRDAHHGAPSARAGADSEHRLTAAGGRVGGERALP